MNIPTPPTTTPAHPPLPAPTLNAILPKLSTANDITTSPPQAAWKNDAPSRRPTPNTPARGPSHPLSQRRPSPPQPNSHPKRPIQPKKHRPSTTQLRAIALLALISATLTLPITILASPARASPSPPTWRWPLDGHPRILRRFTPPPEPWLAGHRGIDLAAPVATRVLAAGPGTIRFAGPVAGRGVVAIDHPDGLRTTYLPVKPSVRRGQPITLGAELGVIEAAKPHCEESCLHWGLRRDTTYLNPLLLLGHAPVRLLPFWPTTPSTTFQSPTAPQTRNPPPTNSIPHSYRFPFQPNSTQPTIDHPPHATKRPLPNPEQALPITQSPKTSTHQTATTISTAPTPAHRATTIAPRITTTSPITPNTLRPHHYPPLTTARTIQNLLHPATTPFTITALITVSVLLATTLVITVLFHKRCSRHRGSAQTSRRNPARGQHRKRRPPRPKPRKTYQPPTPH
ncbi:M23 family metallopeptidase [Nonomuraea antimicrobica]|uniref:M23 family metallopeptidase n=1 Tax=Nonomuraea antimicrobica TaxID=561173 RepID=UPI003613FD09